MPDFQIKIRTDLEGVGMKQAGEELSSLEKEAKKADAELKQTVVTHKEAGEKGEESGKKQVESAEKSTLSHRELRESVRGVGRAFGENIPDLGLWMNSATIGLAAVLTATELLKKGLEYLLAPIEQANEALQAIDAARIKAAAESAHDMAVALGEITDKESSLRSEFDRGTTAMDERIKKYDEQRAAIIKVVEAEETAFEAELEHQTALHPEQKEANDAKKEAAKLALDSLRGQNDAAKLQFEINQREKEDASANHPPLPPGFL